MGNANYYYTNYARERMLEINEYGHRNPKRQRAFISFRTDTLAPTLTRDSQSVLILGIHSAVSETSTQLFQVGISRIKIEARLA